MPAVLGTWKWGRSSAINLRIESMVLIPSFRPSSITHRVSKNKTKDNNNKRKDLCDVTDLQPTPALCTREAESAIKARVGLDPS